MRLFIRNGVYWADVRLAGKRIRFSTKENEKGRANKVAQVRVLNGLATQESVASFATPALSLGSCYDRLMRNDFKDRPHQKTYEANNRASVVFLGANKELHTITQQDVMLFKEWLNKQPEYKTPSTRNKKLLALSTVMRVARDDWGYDQVPKLNMKLEAQKSQRRFLYTNAQLTEIRAHFKATGEDFMHDLTLYLSQTGLRLGEALRLQPSDIRMDSEMIDVWESKGNEPRGVPMTAEIKAMLKHRRDFSLYPDHSVEHRWRKMRDALGLGSEAQIHCLRHTYATRMCEAGVDIQVVQRLLGHRQLTTTTIYAKMTSKRLTDAIKMYEVL